MKVEKMEVDIDRIKFLYYLDKGHESSIIMASYGDKYLIGKLYNRV